MLEVEYGDSYKIKRPSTVIECMMPEMRALILSSCIQN